VTKVPEQPTQILPVGKPGEACEECAAPLAVDQRYCLNCGHRRGEARVDYRTVMAKGANAAGANGAAAAAAVPPAGPGAAADAATEQKPPDDNRGERDFAPLAAVGGIAVLGLMLLVGVLIGRGNSPSATSATPQVVRVPAATGAAAAGGAEAGEAPAGGKAKKSASGTGTGKAEAKSKGLGGGGKEDDSVHEASSSELEELEGESGEDAAKKSLELPNKIATPGAPPPIDKSKPPGGGEGGGLVIK
jgi:hypothetical protein